MSAVPGLAPAAGGDEAIAAGVRAGDAAAFERLMRQYNRRLFRTARALLRDDAEAEDTLQEAYLHAFRAMHSFRGEASLATWLTRIVVNEAMSRLRRQARRHNIVPIHAGATLHGDEGEPDAMNEEPGGNSADAPDEALGRAELRTLLERKIDGLPQDFRAVFVLRAVEELNIEETAQCLGIPQATVRTRYFRARGLLREAMAQELDFAERDAFRFDGARCDRIVATVLRAAEASR
ncbi:RNA polymerase sigma factor [Ramlibacter humi]|uniref:RNA polymerase sigma factor n=1 Tax=Ramlibacter humi TaxID=2530451 RepID=A0A4Z0C9F9_9BURK|nr:RNA polymerase sigma factor [Ramlibacter humi]TFZ07604.1 RNA polymerase sigma factor [Ramlibacter humi]